jgi:antitoxin component YwqK of YwqJK toxin-antitoxin module
MNFVSKILLTQFILIYSSIGLQAQGDQEKYKDLEDFHGIFDDIVDWTEGHSLVNPKGNSISMAKAEIRFNSDIKSFKQAIEVFSFQYQSDSLVQQIYNLEKNGDSLILYCDAISYTSIDEATGELIGAKEELIPYSNEKLLKYFILMQEELRFFYEASTPTLFINAKANFVDTEWLEDLSKELKASLHARTGIWRVYFDNGQLAAKGKYIPFICYNLECLYGENDEMLISEKTRFIKDGLWQTYRPNGELFRILNYNKGDLIESLELINGKLEKVIEPN